jgi:putative transposase
MVARRHFFCDDDYWTYCELLSTCCRKAEVEVWAWVLMPSHVHLILTPTDTDGVRRALAAVHRRYAGYAHARLHRTGHFWQGRFGAVVMDEAHLAAALRYGALNPVRAGLAVRAQDWRWSSVHAHLAGHEDGMTTVAPVLTRYPRFAEFIAAGPDPEAFDRLRQAESIGHPLGSDDFITKLETLTQRTLRPLKRGPKPSGKGVSE